MVGSCFLIHSNNLCLLTDTLRPFMFKVTIEIAGLIFTILSTIFVFCPYSLLLCLSSAFS